MASPITISMDELRTLHAWEERLLKKGLKVPELQASINEPEQLERIIAFIRAGAPKWEAMPTESSRLLLHTLGLDEDSYTCNFEMVRKALELPCEECTDPVPSPKENGEIVVYYHRSWDLVTLRGSAAGQKFMREQHWYDEMDELQAETGYYRVRLCVTGSNSLEWEKQKAHLNTFNPDAPPVPVAVLVTALLVYMSVMKDNPLGERWCRCAEMLPNGACHAVYIDGDQLCIDDDSSGTREEKIFMASATKC